MIPITTFDELTGLIAGFADGHLNTLVICSEGGMGKSEEVDRVLNGQDAVRIVGHLTPLKLYELAYRSCDKPIVFHEIDCLLANPQHVGLLKQLCETRDLKRIMWTSTDPRAAEIDGGRGYFETKSHVLMLCNSFSVLNANVGALKTRATLVHFLPSSAEILAKIKAFATDDEIVAFIEGFHAALHDFSLRTYRLLEDLKNAGLDWRRYALEETDIPPKVKEVADLLVRFDTDIERVEHYSGSRRDYYNWKPRAEAPWQPIMQYDGGGPVARGVEAGPEARGRTSGPNRPAQDGGVMRVVAYLGQLRPPACHEQRLSPTRLDGLHSCTAL